MQISGALGSATPTTQSPGPVGVGDGSAVPAARDTLIQLCRLWPHLNRGTAHQDPPAYCRDFLNSVYLSGSNLDHRLQNQYSDYRYPGERVVGLDSMEQFTGRSLSLIGVLGGVLFILLMIAFASCIKHRKRLRDEEENGLSFDTFSTQLRQLHQARASQHLLSMLSQLPDLPPVPPPDYATVVKEKEEEEDLPTYSEATGELETVYEESESSCTVEPSNTAPCTSQP